MVDFSLLITRRSVLKLSLAGWLGQINPWTYGGEAGPEQWAELSADYHTCGDGVRQSPIDLDISKSIPDAVVFDYDAIPIDLLNNGRTLQQAGKTGGTLTLDNQVYQLRQFHFHTPSEHTYRGVHYPMELHLVHRHLTTKALAVVGIWIKSGAKQPELDILSQYLPQQPGDRIKAAEQVNPAHLLPVNHSLVRYSGSLTTPPCSEGVTWLVMTTPIEASAQQIETFHQLLGNNARPLQR
ncbi:MAG: carbonic anhydrase family protein [Cyanobacteria bacterium P01_C01_bin.118]